MFLARPETYEERSGQDIYGDGFIDRRLDRPATFTRVLHEAGVFGKRGILGESHGGEIKQPGTHDAPAPPYFRDIGQVEIEADVFGQFFAVSVLEDVEAFGI